LIIIEEVELKFSWLYPSVIYVFKSAYYFVVVVHGWWFMVYNATLSTIFQWFF